jgi:hypothetical protein
VRDKRLPDLPATWHAAARDFGTLAGPTAGHR